MMHSKNVLFQFYPGKGDIFVHSNLYVFIQIFLGNTIKKIWLTT